MLFLKGRRVFPDGSVVKNLPTNAEDMILIAGQETKIPLSEAPQLLKPMNLEPVLCNKRSITVRSPRAPTREKPLPSASGESLCSNEDPAKPKQINKVHAPLLLYSE